MKNTRTVSKMPKEYKKLNLKTSYWAGVVKGFKAEYNLDNKGVADRSRVSEMTISNILRDKSKFIKTKTAERLRLSLIVMPEFKKRHANIARKGNKKLLMSDVKKKMEKEQSLREYSKIERIFKKVMKFLKLKGLIK